MKGRLIIMPGKLQNKYWDNYIAALWALKNRINMNSNIERTNNCSTCLDFQQMQPKERIIYCKKPGKPWKIIGTYMLSLYKKHYLCIADHQSKFPVIKGWKAYWPTA